MWQQEHSEYFQYSECEDFQEVLIEVALRRVPRSAGIPRFPIVVAPGNALNDSPEDPLVLATIDGWPALPAMRAFWSGEATPQ
jgi:hypothetical protein